jgi:putative spermidine/putrescine transport system substrate-binding protein
MSTGVKNSIRETLTRRRFLANSAIVGAGLAAPGLLIKHARAAETLVYIGYGGSTQEVINKVFIESFTKETGIEVISNPGADLAKLRAQVQTGNIEWDLLNLIGPQASAAGNDGLLEEIDYGRGPKTTLKWP